jgi:hypothetical protein
MSHGLGSMQRLIIDVLKNEKKGEAYTDHLKVQVGRASMGQGRRVTYDSTTCELGTGTALCWRGAFEVSFYRALNGLQRRGLVTWSKKHGGRKSAAGFVRLIDPGDLPTSLVPVSQFSLNFQEGLSDLPEHLRKIELQIKFNESEKSRKMKKSGCIPLRKKKGLDYFYFEPEPQFYGGVVTIGDWFPECFEIAFDENEMAEAVLCVHQYNRLTRIKSRNSSLF